MAKPSKTTFVCQNCGAVSPRWAGKCPSCGEWNTLIEEARRHRAAGLGPRAPRAAGASSCSKALKGAAAGGAALLDRHRRARPRHRRRHRAGLGAADRRRAGHRQIDAAAAARRDAGARRPPRHLLLRRGSGGAGAPARRTPRALATRRWRSPARPASRTSSPRSRPDKPPDLVVIDSIQTLWAEAIEAAPGTVSQVRAAAQALIRHAKSAGSALLLVGHVTKDGQIAGPKVIEHMVDTVLYFEGDRGHTYRILRAVKNRFGATDEIGVFEMASDGLREVANPSELFLGDRAGVEPGRGRLRRHRRHAAAAGRDPGAGRALRRSARRAAPWSAGTQTGCRCCSPCSKRAAGVSLRRARRLPQRRRRPEDQRAGRRPRSRRRAAVVVVGCCHSATPGPLRRGLACRAPSTPRR